MWNSLLRRLQRSEILPTAWSFGRGVCMGVPGQGIAGERLFIFCEDLDFSPCLIACVKHAWSLPPTGLTASSSPEDVHRKRIMAQVALR